MPIHTIRTTLQADRDASGNATGNFIGHGHVANNIVASALSSVTSIYDCVDNTGDILFSMIGFGQNIAKDATDNIGRVVFDVDRASEHDAASNVVWPASLNGVTFKKVSDGSTMFTFTSASAVSEYTDPNEAYSPLIGLNRILLANSVSRAESLSAGLEIDIEIDHSGNCIIERPPYEDCLWVPNQAYTNDHILIAAKEGEQYKYHQLTTDASTVSASDTFDSFLTNNSAVTVETPLPPSVDKYLDTTASTNGTGDTKYDPYNVLPTLDDGTVVLVMEGSTVGSTTFDFDTPLTVQNGVVGTGGGQTNADNSGYIRERDISNEISSDKTISSS